METKVYGTADPERTIRIRIENNIEEDTYGVIVEQWSPAPGRDWEPLASTWGVWYGIKIARQSFDSVSEISFPQLRTIARDLMNEVTASV